MLPSYPSIDSGGGLAQHKYAIGDKLLGVGVGYATIVNVLHPSFSVFLCALPFMALSTEVVVFKVHLKDAVHRTTKGVRLGLCTAPKFSYQRPCQS